MPAHTLEASQKPLRQIFCDEYLFRIPSYQRPYSWTKDESSDLLDDIRSACGIDANIDDQPPYFLGSIVVIKNPDMPPAEVVDGQQRLTTLTILLAVLRDIEGAVIGEAVHQYICQKGN